MMIVLVVLVVGTLGARVLGAWRFVSLNSWPAATRVGLACMFIFTGVAHFTSIREDMIAMVPPWIPNPDAMVFFTGICEILGAVGLLIPATRKTAAVALAIFLAAVFQANAHAAKIGLLIHGHPVMALIPRLIVQLVFIGLTWWSGVMNDKR